MGKQHYCVNAQFLVHKARDSRDLRLLDRMRFEFHVSVLCCVFVYPKKDNMLSAGLCNVWLPLRIAVAAVGACGFLAAVWDQELAKQT